MQPRILVVAGPTASGKSALVLRIARRFGAEVVNADSMQLYVGLETLTSGPSPEDLDQAPHHLFGVADAADAWSTGRWLRAATDVLAAIHARGRSAVVVGGTGLYARALTKGLAEIPDVPLQVRRTSEADYADLGEVRFRARLSEADPAAAARISPGDRQRLVRAWEVYAPQMAAYIQRAENPGGAPSYGVPGDL